MKRFFFIFLLFIGYTVHAQLWTENFDSYADGVTSGTAGGTVGGNWTSSVPGGGTFEKASTLGERFYSYETGGEGEWVTDPIDISGTGRVVIDMNIFGVLVGAGDYIRCYYRVDGLPTEFLFFEQTGGLINFTLTGSAIVTGTSLEIIVRSDVDGVLTSFSFDDIVVSAVNTLYSRKSGDWNDDGLTPADGDATWSIVGLGGASCNCAPLTTDYLIIGNSHVVNINVAATAGGIEVQNTGELQWTADNIDLNIDRGILQVDAGGTIDRNSRTGVQIDFDRGIVSSMIVNGTVTAEDIEVTVANVTLNISGGGSINLTDDFRILEDDIIVNNDLLGTFTIGDDLIFDQPSLGGLDNFLEDNGQFINNQELTITSDIVVGANTDDDNSFTNSNGGILHVVNLNFADGDFDFFNSGTVNQSGNFINITNTDTNINNLGLGIWNWSFVQAAFDAQLTSVLDCSAVGNTFNYSANGNQRIIPVTYQNLNLSTTGAKDANNASFSVGGNWTVSGTATFTEGTGTITLNGAAAQTLTNAAGETFNNLIINNASAFDITFDNNVTITSVLTMTNGNVDLNGTTITLSSTAAGALSHAGASTNGWMYGGSFRRTFANTTAIAIGNVRGFFPLGSSTDWRPFFVGVNSIAGTAGTITISHTNATTTSDVVFPESIVRRHDSFWTVATSGISAGTWDLRSGGTNFGTVEAGAPGLADLRMSTATGVVGTHGPATGGPDYRVNRTSVPFASLANNYHVASTDAVNSPLPIELVDFTASVINSEVELNWITASELNNDFFTVERSSSGEEFSSIGKVNGRGTTSQRNTYTLTDSYPLNGRSYYRLKQTDLDGTFTYSNIISITYDGPTSAVMQVYPNPSNGTEITFELTGLGETEVISVVVYDQLGREHSRFLLNSDSNTGYIHQRLTFKEPLPKGVYILKAGQTPYLTRRLVVTN